MSGLRMLRGWAALLTLSLTATWSLAEASASSAVSDAAASDAPLSDTQQLMGDGVLVAGALLPDAFANLAPDTRVIDLRTTAEGTPAVAERARELGVDYHNVPVAGSVIDADVVAAVSRLLADAEGRPVLLHCASGNRSGMIWGAVQVDAGRPLTDVLEDLAPLPMRSSMLDALADYAQSP